MSDERQNDGRNYYCLIKLVLVEGTKLARKCIECNLPDNVMNVKSALRSRRNKMEELKKRRIICNWQMRLLYPPNSSELEFNAIDMTLWLVLARNLTTSELHDNQWKKSPTDMDMLWEHDLIRLREVRNQLAHLPRPSVDDVTFDILWMKLASALQRMEELFQIAEEERIDYVGYRSMSMNLEAAKLLEFKLKDEMRSETINLLHQEKSLSRRQFYIVLVLFGLALVGVITLGLLYALKPPKYDCGDHIRFLQSDPLGVLRYLDRSGWGALPSSRPMKRRDEPVEYVIISHTDYVGLCSSVELCCNELLHIQQVIMSSYRNFSDISYHYIIDPNGVVYEGRPHIYRTQYYPCKWKKPTISIAFMGNFQWQHPSDSSMAALESLLNYLEIQLILLSNQYTLYGQCQVCITESPGINLYNELYRFQQYNKTRNDTCHEAH